MEIGNSRSARLAKPDDRVDGHVRPDAVAPGDPGICPGSSGSAAPAGAALTPLFSDKTRARWSIAQRDRDIRQFVILERGFAVAETESGRWAMAAGSILSLPLGAPYRVRFSRGAAGLVMSVTEELLVHQISAVLRRPGPSVWRFYLKPKIVRFWEGAARRAMREQMFRELEGVRKYIDSGFVAPAIAYGLVILFHQVEVSVVASEDERRDGGAGQGDGLLVDRFRGMVELSFRSHLTVAEYCAALGVSKSRLGRACAELVGRSALGIVHDRLLLEAQREMQYSSASLREIAAILGFSDPNYFARFFSKHLGLTPLQFRARATVSPCQPMEVTRPDVHVWIQTYLSSR